MTLVSLNAILELKDSAAILVAVAVIFDLIALRPDLNRRFAKTICGLCIGLIGVALMLDPWQFQPGVSFDARSVLLSISGLFFGLVPTAIAVVITGLCRLRMGGAGVWMGLGSIIISASAGLIWRYYRQGRTTSPGWRELYVFGIVTHLVMFADIALLPSEMRMPIFSLVALPTIVVFPVGTVLLGLLLAHQQAREQDRRDLYHERDLLQRMTETSPVGITVFDLQGRLIFLNAHAESMLGVDRTELRERLCNSPEWKATSLAGEPFPDDCLPFRQVIDRNEAIYGVKFAIVRPDGRRVMLSANAAPLRDESGQLEGVVTVFEDITQRRLDEQRIGKLNRILTVLSNVNQSIVRIRSIQSLFDTACRIAIQDGGFLLAWIGVLEEETGRVRVAAHAGHNDGYLETLEITIADEPSGRGPTGMAMRQGHYVAVDDIQTDERTIPWREQALKRGFRSSAAFPLKVDGQVAGVLNLYSSEPGFFRDEQELRLLDELAMDVSFAMAFARREAERDRAEADLRQAQKMEAVGKLAGGVAHDFNNMLTVILGYADSALRRLDPQDPLHESLQEIRKAGQRSADLTRQLLAFSSKQIVKPCAVDLNDVVESRRKMLSRLIGEDVTVDVVPAEDLWRTWIDPTQIDQILTNLAANSRDAINGVGTVTIETANVTLDESYSRRKMHVVPGDYVMLVFSDTGIGIPPENLDRVFEPFFTTKPGGQGIGLGLSTVYGIVQQNHGVIHAYSEPGMGTSFKIYLPRYRGDIVEIPQQDGPLSYRGCETVLIVEDEEQILRLAKAILEMHGYAVLTAKNPAEACRMAESHPGEIHLLLTDVVMPGMNGRELQTRIEQINPGVKTLFMSGYTANVIAIRGVLKDNVNFIQKPFSLQSLVEKVRQVMDA